MAPLHPSQAGDGAARKSPDIAGSGFAWLMKLGKVEKRD